MTLRVRPVVKRGRLDFGGGERRTLLVNFGFTLAIVASILILVGYGAWSVYNDHLGAAVVVNGVKLTRDDLRARYAIEAFRIDYTESRIRTLVTEGKMSDASGQQQLSFLSQRLSSLGTITLDRIINLELQRQLAVADGITVSDADVQAQFQDEQTIKEQRHAWVIEVKPESDPITGDSSDAQKAAARAKADEALAKLKGGGAWEDVAKSTSTAAAAPQAGDAGWINSDSTSVDASLLKVLFTVAVNSPTDVVEGSDGTFRIGRVTEITPERVDSTYLTRLENAKIKTADYLVAVRADLHFSKLQDKVVADMSQPSAQRHVLKIYIADAQPMPDGVKVRHILFSPKDDPAGAASLPLDDPAWKAAEDQARTTYDQLIADPSKFDDLARTLSDEGSAKTSGGKLPYFDPTSAIDPDFASHVFAPGLKPGDILAPFKSAFGWHVVQFLHSYGNGDEQWLEGLKAQALAGADFAALARDNGEGAEAAKGGDAGWVAKGTLGDLLESAIFGAPIGSITDVVAVPGDGLYMYKVLAEEIRPPTDAQIAIFKSSGFSTWYQAEKDKAKIDRVTSASTSATS